MFRKQMFVAALLSVVALTGPAEAAVEQVSVQVDGMACPFCAYNIEKRVKMLDGVGRDARIVTSVEYGTAKFPWKRRVEFSPEAVRKAIRQAGFTPRAISVTVTGTVKASRVGKSKRTLQLVDRGARLAVSVRPDDRADRLESWDALEAFASEESSNLRVQVEGEVHSGGSGGSWKVILHRWAPLEFGSEVIVEVEDLASEQCSTRIMRTLKELDGVIHAEADHERDRVHIWTMGTPDLSLFRERIETLDFKVTHMHDVDMKDGDVADD